MFPTSSLWNLRFSGTTSHKESWGKYTPAKLKQLSMAAADDSSKTLVAIEDPNPTLRIKLVKSAKEAAERKPNDPGYLESAKEVAQKFRNIFVKAESELDLETVATKRQREEEYQEKRSKSEEIT
ncbi:hypothetical protein JTE90_010425 [Oedothorax gibbosus]|uniref:Uncharacterized protein n=1 Tax=Oedothorax gibbosus TaxID=931172 RepID=A0AAV6W096_9ARAC|nr:hypothetical protein JTE90_010425 [Oedothorax gibbosus]